MPFLPESSAVPYAPFDPSLMAKIALEAHASDIEAVARRYDLPTELVASWCKQMVEHAASLFADPLCNRNAQAQTAAVLSACATAMDELEMCISVLAAEFKAVRAPAPIAAGDSDFAIVPALHLWWHRPTLQQQAMGTHDAIDALGIDCSLSPALALASQ